MRHTMYYVPQFSSLPMRVQYMAYVQLNIVHSSMKCNNRGTDNKETK